MSSRKSRSNTCCICGAMDNAPTMKLQDTRCQMLREFYPSINTSNSHTVECAQIFNCYLRVHHCIRAHVACLEDLGLGQGQVPMGRGGDAKIDRGVLSKSDKQYAMAARPFERVCLPTSSNDWRSSYRTCLVPICCLVQGLL